MDEQNPENATDSVLWRDECVLSRGVVSSTHAQDAFCLLHFQNMRHYIAHLKSRSA